MSGGIGRPKSPSIVDLIICPFGNFKLIVFIVGQTLFSWASTVIKFPVHPESAMEEFSSFDSGLFFVVGAQARLLHICALSF